MTMITNSSSVPLNRLDDPPLNELGPLDEDIEAGPVTVYRLREGIERFLITDINNPASANMTQSTISVMSDWINVLTGEDEMQFNHLPGGANVLYMDGHVEWGSSRVDLQACKLGTGRRFTTS
jgi:hypothetical protein